MIYLGYAIGIVLTFIILVLIIAALKPAHFRIERSRLIPASPGTLFNYINNLANWSNWSPWDKLDPTMKRTVDGPAEGVGASYAWEGNGKVGAGKMTVIESNPTSQVKLRLEFLRPFKCCNTVIFTLTPQGDKTNINWAMEGDQIFMSKVFSMFCNMDKMVGKDFEKGLANLSEVVVK